MLFARGLPDAPCKIGTVMATCFKCGAETGLYFLDAPICPTCSEIEDAERDADRQHQETGFIKLIKTGNLPDPTPA